MATNKKGETKRQHYVPRMVLRGFSTDGATTSVLRVADGRRIESASIKGQCQEDYFYGADQVMERSFAKEEAKIAGYLGQRDRATLEAFSDDILWDFKLFTHYQYARTRAAAERLNHFIGGFMTSVAKGTAELNGESPEYLQAIENVKVGLKNAQGERIWLACKSTPLLGDLAVKFIVTERREGFVVADHPVVAYNQFAEHHPVLSRFPTITGLALKGLQYFMPLSSGLTLAVYDPKVYKYGGNSIVCRAGPRDIKALNAMQAVNALNCVFFDRDRVEATALDDLVRQRGDHESIYEPRVATSPFMLKPDGSIGRFVVSQYVDTKVGAKLSFIKTLDGHSYQDYQGPTIPVRSPQLVEFAKRWDEELEKEVKAGQERRSRQPEPTGSIVGV